LIKNTSKPKEIKNIDKAVIKIGKDWSLNELKLGMANEIDFVSSGLNKNFERNVLMESTGSKVFYAQNESFYVYFTLNKGGEENDKVNTFEGYYVNDLKNVNVAFEAGWKPFAKKEDMIKAIGKDQIEDYESLKYSNYIEVKNSTYKINLIFDDKGLFSSFYVTKK